MMIRKHWLLIAMAVLLAGMIMYERLVWTQENITRVQWEYKVIRNSTNSDKVLNEYGDDGWEVVAWQEPDFLLKRQKTFSTMINVSQPRSGITVRSGVGPSDFVGTWAGETHDKPGEGGTSDTMVLKIGMPTGSDWQATVLGSFPHNDRQVVNEIQLVDERIGFYMQAMDGKTIVWLGLHPREDNKLIGESFALEPDCDGRTIELTRQ